MKTFDWKQQIVSLDARRDIVVPGDAKATVEYCAKQFIEIALASISKHGRFFAALSGGSTPHAIFQLLSQTPYKNQLDWTKVFLFWSDERCVPPDHPESNYFMAMQAGLNQLPIPSHNIFRMKGEENPEKAAQEYEKQIEQIVPAKKFDLVMLGMGEDGHTASLFPHTLGLDVKNRIAIANHVPQKNTWRLSLTYECIHNARQINIYVIGKNKADTISKVLMAPYDPNNFPVQRVGTQANKVLWILDKEASQNIVPLINQKQL